jgi:hypothetical protein
MYIGSENLTIDGASCAISSSSLMIDGTINHGMGIAKGMGSSMKAMNKTLTASTDAANIALVASLGNSDVVTDLYNGTTTNQSAQTIETFEGSFQTGGSHFRTSTQKFYTIDYKRASGDTTTIPARVSAVYWGDSLSELILTSLQVSWKETKDVDGVTTDKELVTYTDNWEGTIRLSRTESWRDAYTADKITDPFDHSSKLGDASKTILVTFDRVYEGDIDTGGTVTKFQASYKMEESGSIVTTTLTWEGDVSSYNPSDIVDMDPEPTSMQRSYKSSDDTVTHGKDALGMVTVTEYYELGEHLTTSYSYVAKRRRAIDAVGITSLVKVQETKEELLGAIKAYVPGFAAVEQAH